MLIEKTNQDDVIKRLPAEIGNHLKDINLEKAMTYLDEAVKTLPDERYCLLSRAEARMRALDVTGATKDIEILLKLYPNDLTAHALNNDIVYLNLEFEKALVLNDKYLKQRKNPPYFFLGYMKCMDAILNALTEERAGHPLRDHYRIIRKTAWDKTMKQFSKIKKDQIKQRTNIERVSMVDQLDNTLNRLPSKKISSENTSEGLRGESSIGDTSEVVSKPESKPEDSITTCILESWKKQRSSTEMPKLIGFPYKPLQRRTSNLANYMSEKYLGQLHIQKCFLKQIPERKGFIVPNQKTGQKLKKLVNNINTYLIQVQALMRSKRPFYHIKYEEGKVVYNSTYRKDSLYRRHKMEAEQYFTKMLHRLYDAYFVKDLKTLIVLISNMVDYYHGRFPRSITRDEHKRIAEAFNVLRDGYFYFGLFSDKMTEQEKITRIQVRLGMNLEKNPSTDSFFNNLRQYNSVNWAPRIKVIEERLKKAQFPEEVIYFNYELTKLNLECGKVELVRRHAKLCIGVARELKDMKWVINTELLLVKASMKQHNKMDSLKILGKALLISKTMNCTDLVEFLDSALKLVQETDFNVLSSPRNIMRTRKKQILKLLDDDGSNRRKAEIIFRKLSCTQTDRTMPLLPGIKLSSPVGQKRSGRKSAIYPRAIQSKITRRVKSANIERGAESYALVKDYVGEESY